MEHNCLNCNHHILDSYCQNCGQKASTHRYSIKHFVEHDFIHGVWHVDKGIAFTLKELFTRPGHSIREFIQGKRANYFSFVTLILLIITASSLLSPYVHIKLADLMPIQNKSIMNTFEDFATKYPKVLVLITIPVNSFFSFIWFRKSRLNYSENLVLNSYKAASELVIALIFSIFAVFCSNIKILTFFYFWIITPAITIYGFWYYFQFFSGFGYSKKALFFRSILVIFTYSLFQAIIGFTLGLIQMLRH
ncbi:DUF3667 domain-containing protein [Pedobacter nototheniae]|uniref:DUF3667 domain-containing protein n=1 Tax=Pedobacter nototheniae TaxID=2488994 RepID=UPI00103C2373|nr:MULTISPECIES: DUF3667 domain-containing protein [Pedobacter]